MRAIYSESVGGGPKSVQVGEVGDPIAEDDQVLIRVTAAGVNVEDVRRLNTIGSVYKGPYLGFECSGHVIATGSKVSTVREGDRVCAFTRGGGSFAEVVAVPDIFVVQVPPGISLMDAAALPQATCLTLWCFSVLRNINPAMKILIHGAGGGFGCIAIQYANYIGCEVYATEGDNEKIQLCLALGAKVCINYTMEDYCDRVKLATNGKGVDIILDCVGGEYLDKNLDCLSIGGSLIVLGNRGQTSSVVVNLGILDRKRILILGASLETVADDVIRDLLTKAVESVWPLISRRLIKPIIGNVYSFSQAVAALGAMQAFAIPGKILLAPQPQPQPHHDNFLSEASDLPHLQTSTFIHEIKNKQIAGSGCIRRRP